jgi:hypothetical protein
MNKDPKYIINFLVNRYFIKFINNSCITFKIIDSFYRHYIICKLFNLVNNNP